MIRKDHNCKVLFWLNRKRGKEGKAAIYLRITVDRDRAEISTNRFVSPACWDSKKQSVKSTDPQSSEEINDHLKRIKDEVVKRYMFLISERVAVTACVVKDHFRGVSVPEKTLNDALQFYINRFDERVRIGNRSVNTLKSIKTMEEKIYRFVRYHFRCRSILLKSIKRSFCSNFEHYLLVVEGLSNNTAMKYIKILKRILKTSVEQEWIKENPADQYTCFFQETHRERLTKTEVDILDKKSLNLKRLCEAKDIFLFCCFTGFAYNDVLNLTPDNVITGIDQEKWIQKNRGKTSTLQSVPLLPIPAKIIERYESDPGCLIKNRLLPVPTNQQFNRLLKEIGVICGFKKRLTTHTARHTFATTVTLENDVPIETVSQMLGHKKITTTQIYAKVTQLKISNNMKVLRNRLESEETSLNLLNEQRRNLFNDGLNIETTIET